MYNRIGQMKHCNYISVRSLSPTGVVALYNCIWRSLLIFTMADMHILHYDGTTNMCSTKTTHQIKNNNPHVIAQFALLISTKKDTLCSKLLQFTCLLSIKVHTRQIISFLVDKFLTGKYGEFLPLYILFKQTISSRQKLIWKCILK